MSSIYAKYAPIIPKQISTLCRICRNMQNRTRINFVFLLQLLWNGFALNLARFPEINELTSPVHKSSTQRGKRASANYVHIIYCHDNLENGPQHFLYCPLFRSAWYVSVRVSMCLT